MAEVDGKPVCVVVPSDCEVSMKKLAAAFGGKSANMMRPADAERLTGYHVDGISPFGQKKRVPVAIEARGAGAISPYSSMAGSAACRSRSIPMTPPRRGRDAAHADGVSGDGPRRSEEARSLGMVGWARRCGSTGRRRQDTRALSPAMRHWRPAPTDGDPQASCKRPTTEGPTAIST